MLCGGRLDWMGGSFVFVGTELMGWEVHVFCVG